MLHATELRPATGPAETMAADAVLRSLCAGEILERYAFSGDFDQSGQPDDLGSDWVPLAGNEPVTYWLNLNPGFTQSPVDQVMATRPIGLALKHPGYRLWRISVNLSSSPEPRLLTNFNDPIIL